MNDTEYTPLVIEPNPEYDPEMCIAPWGLYYDEEE